MTISWDWTFNTHNMKKQFVLLGLLALLIVSCTKSERKHYTVIVSLDGFRWDYPSLYSTPILDGMAEKGVSAIMLPSFPASTFPNHYTLATGLVPDHNGIINNSFWNPKTQKRYSMGDSATRYNPEYYLGEPIWITAQKQGLKAGVLYWVGSDIPIKDTYPTYYKVWDDVPRLTFAQRIDTAMAWLNKPESERPDLIMLYIEEPDMAGHNFGPKSEETGKIVHYVDSLMGMLSTQIATLPYADQVNLIVTSDHGMTDISPERFVDATLYINPDWCELVDGATPTSIFTKEGYKDSVYNVLKDVEHIHVWKKEDIPAELNYGTSDRIGDIVVAPELGWQFAYKVKASKGAHGYFPSSPDMQVMFRAYGPDFKQGYTSSNSFINVDIYPLLAHLLGVQPERTDGEYNRIKDILVE